MLTAKDIMTTDLLTLSSDNTLGEAIELLTKHHVSGAPVMLENELVGIISELAMFDVLFDPSLRQASVSQFMTREVHTVDESETLSHVAHRLALHGIRRLPVLRQGHLIGIITRRDLLRLSLQIEEPLQEPLAELMAFSDEEML